MCPYLFTLVVHRTKLCCVYKFLLRPKWIALHVLIVALVTIMLMLANWQLDRHQQRVAFNKILIERVDAPTQPLEQVLGEFPVASDAEWRSVVVTGEYLQDHDIQIVNVSQGGRAGFDPITPLQLSDGRLILINRGFIPLGGTVQQAPTGSVTLQGRLRAFHACQCLHGDAVFIASRRCNIVKNC